MCRHGFLLISLYLYVCVCICVCLILGVCCLSVYIYECVSLCSNELMRDWIACQELGGGLQRTRQIFFYSIPWTELAFMAQVFLSRIFWSMQYLNLAHQMECLTNPLEFISCIRLVKSPKQALGKGEAKLGRWLGQLSVVHIQADQSDLWLHNGSCTSMLISLAAAIVYIRK